MWRWFRRSPIRINIRSYSEFALLCALIHGHELPEERLLKIIEKLKQATKELRSAQSKSRISW